MRLSQFITANLEPILQDWEDFARSLGAVTSAMDAAALRDHAEQMLTAIALDIETDQSSAQQEAKGKGLAPARARHLPPSAATSHGTVRAEEGFSLQQLIAEYRALRASVLRRWALVHGPPDAESFDQLMRFNEAIDEALFDSAETFARAVDQRTASRARHRMAALGTLAAGLAHDMSNVLLPMRICLREITQSGLNPASEELVDALSRAVSHLAGIARGLRSLLVDPDEPAHAAELTDMHEWWSTAISPFTWALPKGVRLYAEGMANPVRPLPPVRVPAHVVMQAVFNVVQNAAQALGQRHPAGVARERLGSIWITADVVPFPASESADAPGPPARDAVRVVVRDDGPGMDPDTLRRCTEAFFTTKAKDHATGLGLFLVSTTLKRYGGVCHIESQLGVGTSISLYLPVATPDPVVSTRPVVATSPVQPAPPAIPGDP